MSLVLGQQNPTFFGLMPTFRKYCTKTVLVSSLRTYEQDHNSLPCLLPKDFLGHFLIQSSTTFDSRLNFFHWTVWYPRFTKNPLVGTAGLVTHIHTSTSRNSFTFMSRAQCLSHCSQGGWSRSVPPCSVRNCQIFWTLLEVKPILSSRVSLISLYIWKPFVLG